MSKQAIILPYVTYQNEPSRPLPKVFDIPDKLTDRIELLEDLYNTTFEPDEEDGKLNFLYNEEDHFQYGDIVITCDGERFLYVTYLEE